MVVIGRHARIISRSCFLMEQEFLKLQDYRALQIASFQTVGNGKSIASTLTVLELEKDDAED